jgi:hypothetical protein
LKSGAELSFLRFRSIFVLSEQKQSMQMRMREQESQATLGLFVQDRSVISVMIHSPPQQIRKTRCFAAPASRFAVCVFNRL